MVDKLQMLWQIAEEMGIYVEFAPLSKNHPKLLGLYIAGGPAIALDNTLERKKRELKCVFGEEIGHAKTAPRTDIRSVYRSYRRYGECNETIMMAQDERRALSWACDFLIPDVELCRALSEGLRSCWELAEYFEVTEWLVYRKVGFLKMCLRRQGLKVKGRDIFSMELRGVRVRDFRESFFYGAGI